MATIFSTLYRATTQFSISQRSINRWTYSTSSVLSTVGYDSPWCNNTLHVVKVRRSNTEAVHSIYKLFTLSFGMQTQPIVRKVRGLYTKTCENDLRMCTDHRTASKIT